MRLKTKILNFLRKIFLVTRFEKCLMRQTQNKYSYSLLGKLVPNNYQYKKGSIRKFKTSNAVILEVDISDYVGHYLYFGFKDDGHQKLYELVKEEMRILDIGTNIGSTILHFAKLIGRDGIVYGFEPDPINYRECLKNISLNEFKNIKVSNIGLGDKNDKFELYVDTDGNRGGNRISFDKNNAKQKSVIEVEKLDDWSNNNQIEDVDLIKIDVEGFEYKVLIGGESLIRENMPILFIELDDNNLNEVGDSAKNLVKLLEGWGYSVRNSLNDQLVSSNNDFTNCHYDIIAEDKRMKHS